MKERVDQANHCVIQEDPEWAVIMRYVKIFEQTNQITDPKLREQLLGAQRVHFQIELDQLSEA